ncbi:Uncharacterized protein dnm_017760 [Desulfonema magnum]|uniref:Uncharacterized protein n=1 Tax=Desulfonema magnum TaxID=45655 RepID=A0A975BHT3_9BACT|nr:Uncharacterized protein dnm_017760 [Desulfonema magnum]
MDKKPVIPFDELKRISGCHIPGFPRKGEADCPISPGSRF